MKTPTLTKWAGLLTCAICASLDVSALNITLGGQPAQREATLGSAQSGVTGDGNAGVVEVNAAFGPSWTAEGEAANGGGGPGTYGSGSLEIEILSGNWGSKGPITGTWEITNPLFWSTFADAAISMHVGNGGGDPDHFIWLLTDGALSGTWEYDGTGHGGGGLSNMKLFSRGIADVPDGGATAALLGIGLIGMAAFRRKR